MNKIGKKILVTGADGFIGSHLTELLVEQGCNVRLLSITILLIPGDGLIPFRKGNKTIEVFPGDIRDPHGVEKAMDGCDVVFHLAALIAIPFSYHSPRFLCRDQYQGYAQRVAIGKKT